MLTARASVAETCPSAHYDLLYSYYDPHSPRGRGLVEEIDFVIVSRTPPDLSVTTMVLPRQRPRAREGRWPLSARAGWSYKHVVRNSSSRDFHIGRAVGRERRAAIRPE